MIRTRTFFGQSAKKGTAIRWPYVGLGLSLLFVGSYLDTSRGILLPVLSHSLQINYAATSWFLVAGYAASVLLTFSLDRFSRRISTRTLALFVLSAALAATLFAPWVQGYLTLLLLGGFIGACVSGLSAMSSVLVIEGTGPAQRSRYLCALQMMYGLGSQAAPYAITLLFAAGWGWKAAVLVCAPAFGAMALVAASVLESSANSELPPPAGGRARGGEVRVLALMGAYGSGEVVLSTWMATFLVESRGLSIAEAAPYVSGFFLVMATTRGLCFFAVRPEFELTLRRGVVAAGIFFFLLGRAGWLWALPLCGVLGPFYPLTVAAASRQFPDRVRSINLRIVLWMQASLGVCHFVVGYGTDRLGIAVTYWLPAVALALAGSLTLARSGSEKTTI